MAEIPEEPRTVAVLVLEEGEIFGLKIPEMDIELYGPDLPGLIEEAEEDLWWKLEQGDGPVPEAATLALRRVTKEEFGPTCYEIRAEELDEREVE